MIEEIPPDALGQVFTPEPVVRAMLCLRRRRGRVLEPACGDGAFLRFLEPGALACELDPRVCPPRACRLDFFALPEHEKFATIIGNPPYVRRRDVLPETAAWLDSHLLDGHANLYLHFIEKAVRHLEPGGELIFITPRDFLKATAARRLNRWLLTEGSFTEVIDTGDARLFAGAVPNCLIWRFERGRRAGTLRYAELGREASWQERLAALAAVLPAPEDEAPPPWEARTVLEHDGHLAFVRGTYPLRLSQIARVCVGAVSGADEIYADPRWANREFVCSSTVRDGRTRPMRFVRPGEPPPVELLPFRERLLARRVRNFDEHNWWEWGRTHRESDAPRVYVNGRTRAPRPFFVHPCRDWDGSVLAIFPHDPQLDVDALAAALNDEVPWAELGFVCDGRFLFSQRSLERAPLPASFTRFLPGQCDDAA